MKRSKNVKRIMCIVLSLLLIAEGVLVMKLHSPSHEEAVIKTVDPVETEDVSTEAEPTTEIEDVFVAYDTEGNKVALEDVEAEYDGFIYCLKDDDEFRVADSFEEIEKQADIDSIEYVEPNYCVTLFEEEDPDADTSSDEEIADEEEVRAPAVESAEEAAAEESVTDEVAAGESMGEEIEVLVDDETTKDAEPLVQGDWMSEIADGDRWIFERLNVKNVQFSTSRGVSGVTVAVIDSGCALNHKGLDYSNIERCSFSDKYKDGGDAVNKGAGHGTSVIGIINARWDCADGIRGLAPGAKILSIKMFDVDSSTGSTTGGTVDDAVKAIGKAVDKGADVINMSFGTLYQTKSVELACRKAAESGAILVASAGNDGNSNKFYPASYDTVISAGSISPVSKRSDFSNYNDSIDVVAPGEEIPCALANGKYARRNGTSFSAPEVSALAALVKSYDNNISVQDFREILKKTSTDLGAGGYDKYYGYGAVDFEATLDYVKRNGAPIGVSGLKTTVGNVTYTGSALKPAVTIKKGRYTLRSGEDYTVSYSGNVCVGTGTVIITGKGDYYGKITGSFKVLPKKATIKTPGRGKNYITGKWSRQSSKMKISSGGYARIGGYQVQVARNSSFTSGVKTKTVKGYKNTSKKITKLKRKSTYYVRVRTYIKKGGATYYSAWSSVKKTKTK
ncbi:MAG: S8 family serine peptidase [Clostridiales bacterium]|nr:S8 family serine peptidase [Candidatus Crickella caballi]